MAQSDYTKQTLYDLDSDDDELDFVNTDKFKAEMYV